MAYNKIPLVPRAGGTGVANADTSTITLGGALTTVGAFATTLTMTNTTAVTLPTSGTLATTAQIPSVCYFSAYSNAGGSNVTGDGTQATVIFDTLEANSTTNSTAFDVSTYTFTSPITGLYEFTVLISATSVGGTSVNVQLKPGTGSSYFGVLKAPNASSGNENYAFSQSIYMTASSTLSVVFQISGTTKTVGYASGAANTRFQGFYVGQP